jgi:hypothetical protein
MFNAKEFHDEVHALVTKRVNVIFADIVNRKDDSKMINALKAQRDIVRALHEVTEDTIVQILYGLIVNRNNS